MKNPKKAKMQVGDFVKAKDTSTIILWKMDGDSFPTIAVGKADRQDILIVLDTKNLNEKNVTHRWKRAVHVLMSTGQTGWVGQGWLQRI